MVLHYKSRFRCHAWKLTVISTNLSWNSLFIHTPYGNGESSESVTNAWMESEMKASKAFVFRMNAKDNVKDAKRVLASMVANKPESFRDWPESRAFCFSKWKSSAKSLTHVSPLALPFKHIAFNCRSSKTNGLRAQSDNHPFEMYSNGLVDISFSFFDLSVKFVRISFSFILKTCSFRRSFQFTIVVRTFFLSLLTDVFICVTTSSHSKREKPLGTFALTQHRYARIHKTRYAKFVRLPIFSQYRFYSTPCLGNEFTQLCYIVRVTHCVWEARVDVRVLVVAWYCCQISFE